MPKSTPDPATIRETVRRRLDELGWTGYRLAGALEDEVGRSTIYNYLSGGGDLTGEKLDAVFRVLGLKVQ